MASKPSSKLSEIPVPHGYSADEADFYRRGWIDGKKGEPKSMEGYAANLQLAYVTGGLDGALAARPPVTARAKVHTYIGHPRSLCGLAPKNGHYQILSNAQFFAAPDADQCAVCLDRMAKRGYSIKGLRARFLAEAMQPSLQLEAA